MPARVAVVDVRCLFSPQYRSGPGCRRAPPCCCTLAGRSSSRGERRRLRRRRRAQAVGGGHFGPGAGPVAARVGQRRRCGACRAGLAARPGARRASSRRSSAARWRWHGLGLRPPGYQRRKHNQGGGKVFRTGVQNKSTVARGHVKSYEVLRANLINSSTLSSLPWRR